MARPNTALPDEKPSRLDASAVGWDWLFVGLLLVAVNFAVAWLAPRTLVEVRHLNATWERASSPAEVPARVLIVGDSTAGRVDGALLGKRLGRTVQQLGSFAGMTATHSAWVMQHYLASLDAGAPKVEAVVVMHTSPSWTWDRKTLDAWRLDIPVDAAVLQDYGPTLPLTTMQRLDDAVRSGVPLYGRGAVVKRWVSNPVRAWQKMRQLAGRPAARTSAPERVRKDAQAANAAALESKRFKPSAVNVAGLERLIEVARVAGILVFIAPPPVWEGALEMRHYRREYDQQLSWLQGLARRHDHVEMVVGDAPGYPLTAMHDSANHLLEDASADYTERLATALKPRLSEPRKQD